MKNKILYIIFIVCIYSINAGYSQTIPKDTTQLKYNFKYLKSGGLFLKNPSNVSVIYDKVLNKFVFLEKVGNYYIKRPVYMSPKEYKKYRLKRDMLTYFKEKVSAADGKKKGSKAAQKNLLPKYYVNSKFFKSIFGGNTVEFVPSGSVNVKLGAAYQNTEDPKLTEQNRSSFTFDFDQQIATSILAKIGTRLKVTANYDTQTTFDFQNVIKLEYEPTEDDIIRKIDAGNITMPIKNSLINGAQSLFGIKTELQFGKTTVTAVLSQQNSESKVIMSKSGSTTQPFDLRATDYDNDRHFFLSQYFRESYKKALERYPLISSPINITRVEVWVTNRNSSTEDFRSIVAFADLGETTTSNLVKQNLVTLPANIGAVNGKNLPATNVNELYSRFIDGVATGGIRDIATVSGELSILNLSQGTDYSLLQNARKLQLSEYTLHPQLGFISLNRRLDDGEVLAVAYEYTVVGASNGETTFKVGEFSNDGIQAPANLAVKLLRSEIVTTKRLNTNTNKEEAFPTWRLMMKNIYALGAFPLNPDGFRFEVLYRDDQTGIPQNTLQNAQTAGIQDKTILNLLNLDKIDQSQYAVPNGDGFFDYVEGVTVNSQNGYVIFPEPEPFGEDLEAILTDPSDKEKYVFKELYLNTRINAENNFQDKNKFFLKGYFKSENSNGIPLGYGISQGSVTAIAGGRQLIEGVDFVVDYLGGVLQIINPGLQASGVPIEVSTENNAIFNQQRKTFMGVDIEHRFSKDFVLGATVLNVNERPITAKVNFGQEPINNTMFGVNFNYSSEVPYFTKLVNKLPFVDTEVASNISVRGDMAYMLPGTPSGIDVTGAATSYIDDFEASQIPINLMSPLNWFTASTPADPLNDVFKGTSSDKLEYNFKRAKLAWYTIDQIFYGLGDKPSNINANELSRDEVRQIDYSELFPNTELDVTQNTLVRTLDLAYFPSERGPYNLDTGSEVDNNGKLIKPQGNWGGIMRPLTTNNFDQANVEYVQFWIKDPYEHYSINPKEGLDVDPKNRNNQVGDLYFNLGNISEDILSDNLKIYENGLPADEIAIPINTNSSNLGRTPKNPSILYAFVEDDAARTNQDIGLDGVKNDREEEFYKTRITNINKLNLDDISSDNFQYFRGSALDAADASIISRYKNFNNTEGNSPTLNQSTESYPTSSTTYPDVEDINKDQTMNTIESYYEYRISMNRDSLKVNGGGRYVVDEKTTTITLEDGSSRQTKWYQFRVPVRSGKAINNISDFNSIRFMRMYLTNFKMPVVLRFGQLELVRGDWRRYIKTLDPTVTPQENLDANQLNKFEVGVVNLEQNDERYVLPPGIAREQLQGSTTVQQQNEQAVSLKVTDLPQNKIRAIYKNSSVDLRMFKQLKMFMHAEPTGLAGTIADDDMVAIVRFGTDLNDNFYQLEIPLKISPNGSLSPLDVWPEANNLEATLEELGKLKLKRDAEKAPLNKIYPAVITNATKLVIRVKGNPTLATIRTLMLGLKNTTSTPKSAEIWFNELRSSGFENKGGWAAVISADANFADVANVSVSGRMQTIGFGSVEDRVNQRSLEETRQYDIATSVQLHKLVTPKKWGLQVPVSFSYGEEFRDPKFDPQYQDVKFADAKDLNPNSKNAQDYTRRKSISFINVKKNRNPASKKKPRFYDVENISVSYAFNEEFHKDYNIEKYLNQKINASASYNFTLQPKFIEPLEKIKLFKGKYWRWIRDFNINPIPKTFGVNSRINRNFNEQQSRNLIDIPGLSAQPKLTQRRFLFDWDYTIGLDLTKSLTLNFNATNSHIYDSFGNGEELEIFDKFFTVGRPDHYSQKLNATYTLPISKIPFLNFITADIAYTADYDWQAASQSYKNEIGNAIQNANTKNINGKINFSKFYKKIRLDKLLLPKKKRAKRTPNLGLPSPTIANNRRIKTKTIGQKVAKSFYDVLTSVKTAKISYSENNGTFLPGYANSTGFLGRSNGGPTLGFVFGSQVDIRNLALQKGWLVNGRDKTGTYVNKTYSRTHYNKFNLDVSVKPVKDLNITLRANRIKTKDLSQQIDILKRDLPLNNVKDSLGITPVFETGNFSMSYYMLPTMFSNSEELFENFKNNRTIIARRLIGGTRQDATKFGPQEVLIPAFLAAYSGGSANTVGLKPFKNIPIPNWTLRYNGFMKYKWFKKNFSSFSLTHGYKSSYSISNFTNNSQFIKRLENPTTKKYEPELLISSVSLIDEFSPLMRIDMKMKNSFSFKGEIKKDRTLTLNLNNTTLTDVKGTEFILGFGYRIKDVKMKTKITGRKQTLKGDINLQADISLRDNITVIRSVDVDNNQITGGQKLFSFKLQADYRLNSNLTASFYYNHNTSQYAISTTFPRQSINVGFNIIYNFGN